MKGLLIKDLAFVKIQAKALFFLFMLVLFMLLEGQSFEFVIAYANVVFAMFVITTINYDYFENGCAFLMTLPISRKLYVNEKYVLGLLAAGCGFLVDIVFMLLAHFMKEGYVFGMNNLIFALAYALGSLVFIAIMLPIELKYGPEKARIAMIVVMVVIFAGIFLLSGITSFDLTSVITRLISLDKRDFLGVSVATVIIALIVSYPISCRIMEKKEF